MAVKVKELRPGKWFLVVYEGGKRKVKLAGTKAQADAAKKQLTADLARGAVVDLTPRKATTVPTLKEAVEAWLGAHHMRETTRAMYQAKLDQYLYPALGDTPVNQLDHRVIRDFFQSQKHGRSHCKSLLAPLRQAFQQLADDKVVAANPALNCSRYFPKERSAKLRATFLTPEEEGALLAAMPERHYAMVKLVLRSGLRIGEVFGLQWGDVDWAGHALVIRRTVRDGGVEYAPKNGEPRRVEVSGKIIEMLREREGQSESQWVFPSQAGTVLHKSDFEKRVFKPALRKAGIARRVRFHDLRHTYASRMIALGFELTYVSRQLGHSSISITSDTYGHLQPGTHRGLLDRLDEQERPAKLRAVK